LYTPFKSDRKIGGALHHGVEEVEAETEAADAEAEAEAEGEDSDTSVELEEGMRVEMHESVGW
jgi:hypothetical protein